jgi:hypothetical protein
LKDAPDDEAVLIANRTIDGNRFALLWSRMFRAGASRPQPLGSLLWAFAIQRPFLVSFDTRKDAVDLITVRYAVEAEPAREAFEREVLAVEFPRANEPERARRNFRLQIFGTIGFEHLVTLEAQEVVRNAPPVSREASNPRPFEITSMGGGGSDAHWWLREEGVDLKSAAGKSEARCTRPAGLVHWT